MKRIAVLALALIMAGVAIVWYMHGFMFYWEDKK